MIPKQIRSIRDLFANQLFDLYDAEQRFLRLLEQLKNAAETPELARAFANHAEESRHHVTRLETVIAELGQPIYEEQCEAAQGLVEEAQETLTSVSDPLVRDAALIAAAQRIEHYEISGYGTLRTLARHLGFDGIADRLQTTLDEEGAADKHLSEIAEGSWFTEGVNAKALAM